MKINLTEFSSIMQESLLKFNKEWEKGLKENPEYWPEIMNEGDWYDQFLIYLSNNNI